MQNLSAKPGEHSHERLDGGRAARTLRLLLALAWDALRLPALTLFMILEPLVRLLLSAVALLVALTAIFFKLFVHRPDFPFWGMLALSIGCVWVLALYYAVIRLLRLRCAIEPGGH